MLPRRRLTVTASLALLALLLFVPPAPAWIVEVGDAPKELRPTCPENPCVAVSRTTGYQARVVGDRRAYVVPRNGRLVAWTITLGLPDENQLDFFESRFGEASANLTILRPGKRKRLFHRVTNQSPVEPLEPYFGQRVQFPLERSIPVRRGSVIALTVPTWAPALTSLVDDGSSWRASRDGERCDQVSRQTAQTQLRQRTRYSCAYRARLTYSATLITNPKPNPTPTR